MLTSLIALSALGETINIMTLGGLALAVGILVDDATVEVENINRNIDQGKEIIQAILDGASQIAVPALVSTLSICIVFVPMFFLDRGAALSFRAAGGGGGVRDAGVVPAVAGRWCRRWRGYLLLAADGDERRERTAKSRNPFVRMQAKFETGFERFRERYYRAAGSGDPPSRSCFVIVLLAGLRSFVCAACRSSGRIFFRLSIAGNSCCTCALRPARGSKKRRTFATEWKTKSGSTFRQQNWTTIIDNIGLPYSRINLAYEFCAHRDGRRGYSGGSRAETSSYRSEHVRELRREAWRRTFPGCTFYDLPAISSARF